MAVTTNGDVENDGGSAVEDLAGIAEGDEAEGGEAGGGGEGEGDGASEADVTYARAQGWVEKEKFRGSPDDWIDAGTYAKRARDINPIINSRNRDLLAQNKVLQEQIEQVRKDAGEAINSVRAQATREYNAKLALLKSQRAAAIDDGDGQLVTRIEEDMMALEKPAPKKEEPPVQPGYAPELVDAAKAFSERNTWYGEGGRGDPEKTGLALATARTLLRERPDLKGSPDFFKELEYQLKADHPTVFARATPKMVDSGGGRAANGGGRAKKTIADLPKDAQDTARRFVRNGWLANEQQYVDQYLAERAKEA